MLERRAGRTVLVVPLRWRTGHIGVRTGAADREDLFSPVDGFAPALGFTSTIFDHGNFNHTFINGYVSYKFGREDPGYSFGVERPIFGGPNLFLGAELHDMTATDDLWRLTTFEQTMVSVGFKNTFRDYYRRRGGQVFTVVSAGPEQRAERDGAMGSARAARQLDRLQLLPRRRRPIGRIRRWPTSTSTPGSLATRSTRGR